MAAVALGLLIAAATVVLWRRLAGALLHPLEPGMLLGAGISAAAAAAAVHLGWPLSAARRWGVWPDRAIIVSTSLAVGGLVVGLWLPGTSLPPMLAVVAVLLVEAVGVWLWRSRRYALPKPQATRQDAASGNDLIHRGERLPKNPPQLEVIQQLTRVRTADESEELRGWLRVPLAAGQRTASVHVAFCPPLAATPELLVEQIDGPESRLKTGQLLPYGARIDLRLATTAAEPAAVVLEFVARARRELP